MPLLKIAYIYTMNEISNSKFTEPEKKYMLRAIQLARYGAGFVSPNPMVGAVYQVYPEESPSYHVLSRQV